ncbi:MAG: aspartate aminotransferase family protein [Micrococcales bacterium]|nr:aspartate aminotransferase family protein [Micrococcales bacterium]
MHHDAMSAADVRHALARLRVGDLPTHGGHTLSYVYDSGLAEVDALGREALAAFAATNGLDPTAFPSLAAMESELVADVADLLDAPDTVVGTATSGGTESIVLAVLAARESRRDIGRPKVVVPSTAHAAFHKAGHLLGLEIVAVPVDPATHRADPDAMAAAITDETVLVVASAPSYAHGVIDPVEQIAAAAAERGVRCHVDACIGGFVLPFLDEPLPPWTFAVDGVTSISVDLHKYAYTPKGVSLLLHREPALRRGHLFASADWPGYTMLNTTLQSTKSGGPLAAAWAVTRAIGRDGYAALAGRARAATLEVADAVADVDGLEVVAAPDSTLLCLRATDGCDVLTVADELLELGWYAQPQLSFGGDPASLHLTLCAATASATGELIEALRSATAAARRAGPVQVDPELAAAAGAIDADALDDATLDGLLAIAGLAAGDGSVAVPKRMAPVNALLDVAPPPLREALLLGVLDRLTRPAARGQSS